MKSKKPFIDKPRKLDNDKILELMASGMPMGQIARKFNMHVDNFNAYAEKNNLLSLLNKRRMIESVAIVDGIEVIKYKAGYAIGAEPRCNDAYHR
tara:strand:+ start:136 stop:420 length:285 start_codon:yes stop_codon:yes gene_type:complete